MGRSAKNLSAVIEDLPVDPSVDPPEDGFSPRSDTLASSASSTRHPTDMVLPAGKAFWGVVAVLSVMTLAGVAALAWRLLAGPQPLANWGYVAATVSFILSTAHAVPLLAVATRESGGFWGAPLRRACELFGAAGLVTTPLFILLLNQLPPPGERPGIWSGWPGAPLFWDGLAVALLGVLGFLLLYVASLPDLAALRDARSIRRSGYLTMPGYLSIGWRGTTSQWKMLSVGLTILGVLYGMVYLLVHLVVVTELAVFLVPGWASEIAPVQGVISGLQAGVATTLLILAALRRYGRLRRYIGPAQFHPAAALLLTLSLLWLYLGWSEFLTLWYGRTPVEQWLLAVLMFGPSIALFLISLVLTVVLPVLLLIWNPVRNSIAGPTLVAALVLLGSFVDRVRIHLVSWSMADLAPQASTPTPAVSPLGGPAAGPATLPLPMLPAPDVADLLVVLGGPAAILLLCLLATRLVPIISAWEWNGAHHRRFMLVYGAATVTFEAARNARGTELGPVRFSWSRIRDDLLRFPMRAPGWFWWAAGALALLVLPAVVSVGLLSMYGLQLMGHTHVQQWAVPIVNFSFWSGVSHAGITVSAILRLNHAEWRRPITRAAETIAIFAVVNSAVFAIFHTGRPWRTMYWLFPYDFTRDIWPNVRSMLIWDASALFSYLIGTMLFVYATLIPDLAIARDVATGWRRRIYALLALGFRGTARQWQIQSAGARFLVTLLLVMFVTDHSIVAWDLSMAVVPGWHTAIMGPYFISGAVYSGLAAVVVTMAALRWTLRLEAYVTRDHFDFMARFLLVSALIWLFFFLTHLIVSISGADPVELRIWELRLLVSGPYTPLTAVFLLTACLIPVPLWLVGRCRRSPTVMMCTALLVSVGLWLERYLLIMPPLSYKHPFVFTWDAMYEPSLIEYILIVSPFALVALGLLVFARLFPIVPLYEVKEGALLERDVRIGATRIPGFIRETVEVRS